MSPFTRVLPPAARRLGLLALGLATLLPMLAGSMASMLLPALGADFAVPFASLQWVLVAYLLGITCLTVVAGRLGDRFGRRRLLLLGLGLFALASLLCALAPTIGWLIAARVLQGGAAACMLSLALAMVGQLVPPARRGRGMGLLGTLSACGTALGPSFGGLLLEVAGWQSAPEGIYIARARHVQALQAVGAHLQAAADQLATQGPALDLLAEELRLAQNALSDITGEFSSDDLLGVIFSSFCIGK